MGYLIVDGYVVFENLVNFFNIDFFIKDEYYCFILLVLDKMLVMRKYNGLEDYVLFSKEVCLLFFKEYGLEYEKVVGKQVLLSVCCVNSEV